MQTPRNEFKAALKAGSLQVGLWIALTDSVSIEIAAGSGYDWLLLDGEHSPHDLPTMLMGLQVMAGYPVHPVVRVPGHDPVLIKKVLDIGAQNILVPAVETAEQARALVEATRYPPNGIRGVGTALARAARWNRRTDYLARADEEICLILQIETRRGLEALDSITAVDGVDALFIGPADLAASLGHLGAPGHADVQAKIHAAISRVRAAGKSCGSLSADPVMARSFVTSGCNFMAIGTDTVLLATAAQGALDRFRGNQTAAAPATGSVY